MKHLQYFYKSNDTPTKKEVILNDVFLVQSWKVWTTYCILVCVCVFLQSSSKRSSTQGWQVCRVYSDLCDFLMELWWVISEFTHNVYCM